jgi:RNA polymerase sigma factor (sigma-70 family)
VIAADAAIGTLLESLRSDESENAWTSFLTSYSDLIYGVIQTIARNADHSGDCFLFVCSKLADKNYKRLLAFRPDGRARFSTWLRAVVRNLCLDWYRSEFGRPQLFRSVAALNAVDQNIFQYVFHQGMSLQETWVEISDRYPGIGFSDLEDRVEKLRSLLTARQLWLLSSARLSTESIDSDAEQSPALEVSDTAPDPETIFVLHEARASLAKAISQVDPADQLLLRLRFVEGLGLLQVAKLVGLKDAQTADRRIRSALVRLRDKLGVAKLVGGKRKSASV